MSEPTNISSSPKRKRNWLGILLKVGVALLVLVLVAYFVATSSFFLKSVILPRVGKALNASVTVSEASIHPFSAVTLHNLKVQAAGKEPLVTVNEVRLRYHLWDIIGGNIHVDEIAVDSPTVELVVSPDGTSNLDPILKALQEKSSAEKQPEPTGSPSKPLKIDLAKLTVSNANIRQTINYPGGSRDVAEVTNVSVTLSNLKNGETAKLELAAGIHVDKNSPNGPQGKMVASVNGNFDCALSPDLKPGTVNGGVNLMVSQTGGAFTNLDAFGVALACDVTPSDVKQLAVKFQKAGEPLGELTVTGPFSAEKMEGKLDVELNGIDRRLLNLAGGPMGADFGTTTISSRNEIELAKGGTVITANGKLNIDKLRVTRAGQTTPTLDFSAAYDVMADRTAQLATLNRLDFTGTQNGAPLLDARLSNPMSLPMGGTTSSLGDAALNLTVTNLDLTDWKPFLGGAVTAGDVGVNLKVSSLQGGKQITLTGDIALENLFAQMGKNELQNFGTKVHLDVASSPDEIKINQVAGSFSQNGKPGGGFTVTGTCKPVQKSTEMKIVLSDLNDNLFRPLLEPALGGKKLASLSISGNLSCQYDQQTGSAVKGSVKMSNLVVNDPATKSPLGPLAADLSVDASFNQQIAEVRQLQIALTPTARAANKIQFSGRVDLSKTDAISGDLKLAADSLDFTSYYDLVAGGKGAGANAPAKIPPTAESTATGPEQEPPAVHLPLQDFTLAANIGQIYLHEIAVTNFEFTTKINDSHVVVDPFRMTLNGAPVSSTVDVDLGMPGYKYDIDFSAKKIPLAPLVNTFQPDRAGQLGGTVVATAQIKGAGVTGASLKKNLAGQYDLEMTNLNLAVINVHNPLLRSVINVVATLPQLIKSPENVLGSLLSSATGKGGLMGDLEKSPLDYIGVQGSVGGGQVELKQADVRSSEFDINAAGDVMLDSVLTNSTLKIPVTVSLSHALAKQLNLVSSNTPANAAYVALPQFLTMTGTLGAPKANIDKVALAGTTLKAFSGNLLKSSGTNASPVGGLLDKFFKPKK